MANQKTFLIENKKTGSLGRTPTRYYYQEGTLSELIKAYGYTLECGKSWEHEKGNKKINTQPKSIKTLVKNLNDAVNNSAQNGYAGQWYSVVTEKNLINKN